MINRIRIFSLILAICLLMSACSLGGQEAEADVQEKDLDTNVQTEEPKVEQTTEEPQTDVYVGITDMAGRQVVVPSKINTAFGVNNTASILLYTIVPEKMIGWNIKFSDKAKALLIPENVDLPVLGNLYGSGSKAEIEEIISKSPDVIIFAATKVTDTVISAADKLQEQLSIPVLVVVAKMATYDKAYEFLGIVFDKSDNAKVLSDYSKAIVSEIDEVASKIVDEKKVGVYYARGDDGLTTEFSGSPNAEVLRMVGGKNIIQSNAEGNSGAVNIETIIDENPSVILIGNQGASLNASYEAITQSGLWKGIDAVEQGSVINTPQYPFNWFDRPPTVNRLIGLIWLAEELYPDEYDYDLFAEVKVFFKLFYGVEVTDEQIEEIVS